MSSDPIQSASWGIFRGILVHAAIFPLEVVKIRQQCAEIPIKSHVIVTRIFQSEGIAAFYQGLAPQLVKTAVKQAWCWPLMTWLPNKLNHLSPLQQQAITGLTISTIDAGISTPLERAKITSAFTGKSQFSWKAMRENGWKGFGAHWSNLSVKWATFLVAQKHFREQYRTMPDEELTLSQLTIVGIKTACVVSVVAAPFDIANTVKQAQNRSIFNLMTKSALCSLYRGWPLSALTLVVHNIASAALLEKLRA